MPYQNTRACDDMVREAMLADYGGGVTSSELIRRINQSLPQSEREKWYCVKDDSLRAAMDRFRKGGRWIGGTIHKEILFQYYESIGIILAQSKNIKSQALLADSRWNSVISNKNRLSNRYLSFELDFQNEAPLYETLEESEHGPIPTIRQRKRDCIVGIIEFPLENSSDEVSFIIERHVNIPRSHNSIDSIPIISKGIVGSYLDTFYYVTANNIDRAPRFVNFDRVIRDKNGHTIELLGGYTEIVIANRGFIKKRISAIALKMLNDDDKSGINLALTGTVGYESVRNYNENIFDWVYNDYNNARIFRG